MDGEVANFKSVQRSKTELVQQIERCVTILFSQKNLTFDIPNICFHFLYGRFCLYFDTLFLSGELQRKIGVSVLDKGGNAVIG